MFRSFSLAIVVFMNIFEHFQLALVTKSTLRTYENDNGVTHFQSIRKTSNFRKCVHNIQIYFRVYSYRCESIGLQIFTGHIFKIHLLSEYVEYTILRELIASPWSAL